MNKITLLPKWIYPNTIPSVYDGESKTCLDMTAKVYGAMRNLQEEYNLFVDEINKCITDFIESGNKEEEEFEARLTKIIHDYIHALDLKVINQDRTIEESIVYIKENLSEGIKQVLNDMKESGELAEVVVDSIEEVINRIYTLENRVSECENRFIPTKTSELDNDADFATKTYVDTELATFDFIKVVDTLPEVGLPNRIYFVPKSDTQTQDLFDEYAWINDKWEWITTKQIEVDLTPYYKKTETYSKGEVDYTVSDSHTWKQATNNGNATVTIPKSWNNVKDISIKALGTDGVSCGYVTIPKEQWYNNGLTALKVPCIDENGTLKGCGVFHVSTKNDNDFIISLGGVINDTIIYYR